MATIDLHLHHPSYKYTRVRPVVNSWLLIKKILYDNKQNKKLTNLCKKS